MKKEWSDEQLENLFKLVEDDRPLFAFVDEVDQIIECEWFDSTEQAVEYARTLPHTTVYVARFVGCAENENEIFIIYDD